MKTAIRSSSVARHISSSRLNFMEALGRVLSSVYSISPSFRVEPSRMNRYLSEYQMLEVGRMSTKSGCDVCVVAEVAVKCQTEKARHHSEAFADYDSYTHTGAASPEPWTRSSYTDAIQQLEAYHASTSRL